MTRTNKCQFDQRKIYANFYPNSQTFFVVFVSLNKSAECGLETSDRSTASNTLEKFTEFAQSNGSFRKAFQTLLIWLLIIALLCGPLTGTMKEFIVASRVQLEIRKLREEHPAISLQHTFRTFIK